MALRTMIHPHREDDEVKDRTGAGRVLAVMLELAARTGSSPELSWERK
jgi:hypothetical protein